MSKSISINKPGAIITGAASGVGLALTKHLLSKGWAVVMADISPEGEVIAKDQVEMFSKAFQWCPSICFLAANAGMVTNMAAPFGLLTPDIDGLEIPSLQVLDVNLTGTIYGIKIFLHHIQRLNPTSQIDGKVKARIVITGSEGGFYPLPSDPVYTSSKHGLVGLTRALGGPYLQMFGITVNSINPGYMKTTLVAPLIAVTPDQYETPLTTIMRAYDELMEGSMTGETIEASGRNLYYPKQQPYADEAARWLWEDAPAFWVEALTKLGTNAAQQFGSNSLRSGRINEIDIISDEPE